MGIPSIDVLHALRKRTGRKQLELAEALGVAQPQYSRMERGSQSLSAHQWVALGPLLALDEAAASYRGSLVHPDDLLFLPTWAPIQLHAPRFACDEKGNIAAFESGIDACHMSGAMSQLGAPCAALPASRTYALIGAPFYVAGATQTILVGRSEGKLGDASIEAAEFMASALRSLKSEHTT